MKIELNEEMIYKISCVAFGRKQDLLEKEKKTKEWMTVGERQIAKKHIMLNDIKKAKADAEEVHEMFLALLNEIEEQ